MKALTSRDAFDALARHGTLVVTGTKSKPDYILPDGTRIAPKMFHWWVKQGVLIHVDGANYKLAEVYK